MTVNRIEIKRYHPDLKRVWNDFVESSKNGTFLFNRDYMEYHAHRFIDNSYLFYRGGKLYSLLPANIQGETLFSHQGLTYGGLVMDRNATAEGVLECFKVLIDVLKKENIKRLIYKSVPYIYSSLPAQEDLYALFRNNAMLVSRSISSTINFSDRIKYSTLRKRMVKRACENGITVKETTDLKNFWKILEKNLMLRHNVRPVHSYEEIRHLADLFSENIRLVAAFDKNSDEERMIAGVLCYISRNVIHSQYIAASPIGKETGALDVIFNQLLNSPTDKSYFDFGISTEEGGKLLNENLIHQKEGFGARGVCYDVYEVKI